MAGFQLSAEIEHATPTTHIRVLGVGSDSVAYSSFLFKPSVGGEVVAQGAGRTRLSSRLLASAAQARCQEHLGNEPADERPGSASWL